MVNQHTSIIIFNETTSNISFYVNVLWCWACGTGPSKGGKDWRAGRAGSVNIIPSTTGAAKVYQSINHSINHCMLYPSPTTQIILFVFDFMFPFLPFLLHESAGHGTVFCLVCF